MISRREFFERGAGAVFAGGLAGWTTPKPGAVADAESRGGGPDYYERLGVTKVINAAGTYTYLTASIMPAEVQAAVMQAARYPVRLRDLQKAAGEYLARRLQCEAALVTCGAAAALTIGTAASMTVGKEAAVADVPARVSSFKTEVIIQKAHRFSYDHAVEMCGTRFKEVETLEEYENGFAPQTVMALFLNNAAGEGKIGREDWIRVAHGHGVPCFNDAAADVPPISNLWNYTKMGFDLVCFSGGKGIRGPQNAGLLLGRKDLIAAAIANNNPNDRSVGRGMKVAKEQIVGMVAAVDWFLEQTGEGLDAEFRRRAERVAVELKGVPSLTSEINVPPVANHVPHLMIHYDQQRLKIKPAEVAQKLRDGTPSIELNPATGRSSGAAGLHSDENTIVVGVWMLQPGEDRIVGRRLKEVLTSAMA